jgi:probable rRNA maturation factor
VTTVDVQIVCDDPGVPVPVRITEWARAALEGHVEDAELTVRVVGEEEGAALNAGYRHREGATNVLSFPFEPLP